MHRSVTMREAVAWLASAGGGPIFAREIPTRFGSIQALTNALRHAERHGKVMREPAGSKASRWLLVPGADALADAFAGLEKARAAVRQP